MVHQPGDGSCLFHSMAYGVGSGCSARALRNEIARFLVHNASTRVAGTAIADWIKYDSRCSVREYAMRMNRGGTWGGGMEMLACSLLKGVSVHVYEHRGGAYKRISLFPAKKPGAKIVRPPARPPLT